MPPPPTIPGPPPPVWDDDDLPPPLTTSPPTDDTDIEPGFFGGLLGELVAGVLGAGMGMAIAATSQCPPFEDCGETLALAALVGGSVALPLGAVFGVYAGAELAHQRGDEGWTILTTLAGYVIGGLVAGLGVLIGEPGAAIGGVAIGAGVAPLLGSLGYGGHW